MKRFKESSNNKLQNQQPVKNSSLAHDCRLPFCTVLQRFLNVEIPPIQFKKQNNETKFYEIMMRENRNICKNLNSGIDTMFNVTFSCQDSQLQVKEGSRNWFVEKDEVKYPQKTMPIDSIRIEIEFCYKKSITEFTKLSELNEEELINSLIEIIDLDDHQVYFKMKTNHISDSGEEDYRYIVIGKMDNSRHAFIFDISQFHSCSYPLPHSLKHMYEICKPNGNIFNKLTKGSSSTDSDKSIRRVGFGHYFRSDTCSERHKVWKRAYNEKYPQPIMPNRLYSVYNTGGSKSGNYGLHFLKDDSYESRGSGVVDVGYYSFKLKSRAKEVSSLNLQTCYTCKLTQEVKYR